MKIHSRMRSLLCTVLALFMVLSLAACGGDPSPAPSSDSEQISGGGTISSEETTSSESPASEESNSDGTVKKTPEQIWDEMAKKMVAHYEVNDDTVGWLYVPNTVIDEVVVQAPDNDYYLRRNNLKKNAFEGCYYADYRAVVGKRAELSKNTVIYGHSMDDNPDGNRFSQLKKYLDIEFCKQNPYIYFNTTESDNMVWQVFAVFYTEVKFNYNNPIPDNSSFLNIITDARKRSQFNFDVDVGVNDHILTLSTCTYLFDPANRSNYRYVVMAKLLPSGTEPSTSPVKVEVNPSPKAPQA